MYIPKHFEGTEAQGREIMQGHGWALLTTADADGAPLTTHLSLVWEDDGSPHGSLIGHMARANGHWKLFSRGAPSLALFWGPHAYVSPTWYAPGPKVPTWNYVTVHAYGRPEIVEATPAVLILIVTRTDLGRAIRAVAKEKHGARLMGIDVDHVYAMSFGIGMACLGAAACFLLPAYYVNPQVGNQFVLIAFTTVVLGGMGSFMGALLGGLIIGLVESLGGLWLGESLGQIGIFVMFILVLLFRPSGLFGERA